MIEYNGFLEQGDLATMIRSVLCHAVQQDRDGIRALWRILEKAVVVETYNRSAQGRMTLREAFLGSIPTFLSHASYQRPVLIIIG